MQKILDQINENSLAQHIAMALALVMSGVLLLITVAVLVLALVHSAWWLLAVIPCVICASVSAGIAAWLDNEYF